MIAVEFKSKTPDKARLKEMTDARIISAGGSMKQFMIGEKQRKSEKSPLRWSDLKSAHS